MEKKPRRYQGRNFMLGKRLFVVVDANGRVLIPKGSFPAMYTEYGFKIYMKDKTLCAELDKNSMTNQKVPTIRMQIPTKLRKELNIEMDTIFECKQSTQFEGIILEKIEGDLIGR